MFMNFSFFSKVRCNFNHNEIQFPYITKIETSESLVSLQLTKVVIFHIRKYLI